MTRDTVTRPDGSTYERQTIGQRTINVEGVTYLPFRVTFRLADGRC